MTKPFAGFFDGPGEEGIKNYTPDEERFEEPFKIDTSINMFWIIYR